MTRSRKRATTQLWNAVIDGTVKPVLTAIQAGANINARDAHRQTPLHLAATYGHAGVAKVLIKSGAKVGARDNIDQTPLHMAAAGGHAAVAIVLLKNGARLNAKALWDVTPMQQASFFGHIEFVTTLLNAVEQQKTHPALRARFAAPRANQTRPH